MSPWGPRRVENNRTQFHLGIDVGAPRGTAIRSPLDGIVIATYPDGAVQGYGNVASVRYGDVGVLFSHMGRMNVFDGQRISAGQMIGLVGTTNSETGGFRESPPHSHIEVLTPAPDDVIHALAHFSAGTRIYPQRMDPMLWAQQNDVKFF